MTWYSGVILSLGVQERMTHHQSFKKLVSLLPVAWGLLC